MTHSLKQKVTRLLEEDKEWRERRLRLYKIASYLCEKYHLTSHPRRLADILKESETLNRLVRQVQQEDESLRGKDWTDAKKLSQEYQLGIDYEPQLSIKNLK
ncbi:MAG: hypothetical protein U1E54_03430 [Candidatus Levybacteria bacterium]|nr:hypothetical protein [Candidatus Levybacteria bacterium]